MDMKELKKLADALDDKGKQELIHFLQSRTKGMSVPIRAIDEIQEQKHKDGLICPHCKNHAVVRFGKYLIKTHAGEVIRQRYRCKSCHQTFNDLTNTPGCTGNEPSQDIHLWYLISGGIVKALKGLFHDINKISPTKLEINLL